MYRKTPFTPPTLCQYLAGLLLAIVLVIEPSGQTAQAQSIPQHSTTVGELRVTVTGDQAALAPHGEGYRATVNGLSADILPGQLQQGAVTFDTIGAREITIEGLHGAFRILADGRLLLELSAFEVLERRSETGDMLALGQMADRLFAGNGIAANPARATRLLRQAAEAGQTAAQSSLAHRLYAGDGMEKDHAQARIWAERAASPDQGGGHPGAAGLLGYMLLRGLGGPADTTRGLTMLQTAIDAQDTNAMLRLGYAFATGEGVEQDLNEAVRYTLMAAEAGDAAGQRNLVILGIDSGFTALSRTKVQEHLDILIAANHPDAPALRAMFDASEPAPVVSQSDTPAEATPDIPKPPPLPQRDTPRYWYAEDDTPSGPITRGEFLRLRDSGVIAPDTLVWEEGLADWVAAEELAVFTE